MLLQCCVISWQRTVTDNSKLTTTTPITKLKYRNFRKKREFAKDDIANFLQIANILTEELLQEMPEIFSEYEICREQSPRSSNLTDDVIIVPKVKDDPLTPILYRSPGPWSSCRRSCLASRTRECRRKHLCMADYLVEEAWCYIPGTKCEKKVREMIEANDKKKKKNVKEPKPDYDEDKDWNLDQYDIIFPDNNVTEDDNTYYDYDVDTPYDYGTDEPNMDEGINNNYDEMLGLDAVKPNGPSTAPGECGLSSVPAPFHMFRIIGGREVIEDSWPWQVAILNRFKELFCGGTLIAPRWVLTASHCVRKKLYVRVAEHDIRIPDGEVELLVSESFKHPNFSRVTIDCDIALLKLPQDIPEFTRQPPTTACLPTSGAPLPMDQTCVALGWGKERETHIFGSDVLRFVKVPIVKRKKCKAVYGDEITRNMFCAGVLKGGMDTCEGDSGGPLLCQGDDKRWVLQGVTSFGEGCGDEHRLGVYVKVSNFIPWINDVINALEK